MIERNYRARFSLKPRRALRISKHRRRQKFERGFAARDNVGGQIDFTHPAGAQQFRNLVVTDHLTNQGIGLLILNDPGRKTDS